MLRLRQVEQIGWFEHPASLTRSAAVWNSNLEKHGIDFHQAQALWQDPERLVVPAKSEQEPRQTLVARWKSKVWAAVFTERGQNVRMISVRRARDYEKAAYEQDDSQESGTEV